MCPELLSRLLKNLFCSICTGLLVFQSCSQGLQETFSALCIVILQASIPTMICPSLHFKEGLSKAFFHRPIILHKGFTREGFSKCSSSSFNQPDAVPETNRLKSSFHQASLSVVNTSAHGRRKASARPHYLYSNLLLKGPARKGFNKRSPHHSINQTRYRKSTDMHPPPPNINT